MIKCKKQFIAFFMAISIVFCVGSESYLKAQALEWAIPTITAAEAIKWLLGLLGVTVAGVAIADTDYEQLVENYNNYAEIKGQTAVETGKFWADIIDGTLDQGSQAWSNFKEWVGTITSPFSGSVSFEEVVTTCPYYNSSDTFIYPENVSSFNLNNCLCLYRDYVSNHGNFSYTLYYGVDSVEYALVKSGISNEFSSLSVTMHFSDNAYYYISQHTSSGYTFNKININSSSIVQNLSLNSNNAVRIAIASANTSFLDLSYPSGIVNPVSWSFDSSESNFNVYDNLLINTLALTLSSAISDAIPDVIPLPWDQVSDTAEGINDKINELIEKVNEGVLSLEDYMIAIQSILGVIAFDTTTDLVIPSDPDLPDETIQDKINENVANNGFVLTGLENFFPFCIPFDIYAFITILVAEPVAPVIHWEIYNPVTQENNEIVLDFAMWESVVILMRYIFDFLFIIGLALLARSLIGGDD